MSAPLIEQEIYLLERYSSLDYFGIMRDHFASTVKAANDALAAFMQHLPPDYRSQHLSHQPDAVWGERVIPNMQWALDGLNDGYIHLSHGNLNALGQAANVEATFAGICRDYHWDWMPQPFYDQFDHAWRACSQPASNINLTALAQWRPGSLSARYKERNRGPLAPPPTWPQYRLNPQVRVKTGDKVTRNGIYLPDVSNSCAQLLIEGHEAWGCTVLRHPEDPTSQVFDRKPTTWTLVERIADEGGGVPGEEPWRAHAAQRLRCEAGNPCPHEGWWFTPAGEGRRHFKQGVVMPELKSDYGQTIWHWCSDQR
jgi:hypothetical protein